MAEIVAVTYYKALHDATNSATLRTICRQILRDEIQHLHFQMNTLEKLRLKRSPLLRWLMHQVQRIFFAGTLLLVWPGHAKVYRAGGFTVAKFIRSNWSRFERSFNT
jgi:rubrerythrin